MSDEEIIGKISPVGRLSKSYGNQKTDGDHMVDLIDVLNGHVIARCVYESYADQIIAATWKVAEQERQARIQTQR